MNKLSKKSQFAIFNEQIAIIKLEPGCVVGSAEAYILR